jgi:hypothetical protein
MSCTVREPRGADFLAAFVTSKQPHVFDPKHGNLFCDLDSETLLNLPLKKHWQFCMKSKWLEWYPFRPPPFLAGKYLKK